MAELRVRSSNCKKKSGVGIMKLKFVVEKLQKSLFLGRHKSSSYCDEYEEGCDSTSVPEDVEEGHFAVIAEDEEPKRFVVPLSCLSNPTFFTLLEQGAEEYGFDQDGALNLPCRPSELEMLLDQQRQQEEGNSETAGVSWNSCKSY